MNSDQTLLEIRASLSRIESKLNSILGMDQASDNNGESAAPAPGVPAVADNASEVVMGGAKKARKPRKAAAPAAKAPAKKKK